MSASQSKLRTILVSWGAFVIVMAVGIAFMGTLIRGIILGNETAHDLDHGNRLLDERLVELADMRGTAPIAALPFASADTEWDVVCYVDAGHWVGKVVADRLGLDVHKLIFEPRNIYVVDRYWALAFIDTGTDRVRIVEVNRKPVTTIDGPECLARDGAEVAARPTADDIDSIVVSFMGTPAPLP